ncbi:MAG: erythrose-4-phosphate dehydrogenase, partial [Proteobacteria bacterium]|nr:erythrose-4-phosphate dehydrogenase [Pseudomonadota bacterium]
MSGSVASATIGINGFGRIGRNVLRLIYKNRSKHPVRVSAINDLTDAKTLAHLLKYDSVHGRFDGEVAAGDGYIEVNGDKIKILSEKDPGKLPWKELGADFVLEC